MKLSSRGAEWFKENMKGRKIAIRSQLVREAAHIARERNSHLITDYDLILAAQRMQRVQ